MPLELLSLVDYLSADCSLVRWTKMNSERSLADLNLGLPLAVIGRQQDRPLVYLQTNPGGRMRKEGRWINLRKDQLIGYLQKEKKFNIYLINILNYMIGYQNNQLSIK